MIASIGLSVYWPRRHYHHHLPPMMNGVSFMKWTLYASLLGSFSLLSLAVLEVTPVSWNVWMVPIHPHRQFIQQNLLHATTTHKHITPTSTTTSTMDTTGTNSTLFFVIAYQWLLAFLACMVLVIVPCHVGAITLHHVPRLIHSRFCTRQSSPLSPGKSRDHSCCNTTLQGIHNIMYQLTQWIYQCCACLIVRPIYYIAQLIRSFFAKPKCERETGIVVLPLTTQQQQQPPMKSKDGMDSFVATSNRHFRPFGCTLPRRRSVVGCAISVVVTCMLAQALATWLVRLHIPPPKETTNEPASPQHYYLATAVSWMCAVGILLSSLMNGFGSASLPFTFLSGLFLAPISSQAVAHAQRELDQAQESLTERQEAWTHFGDHCPLPMPNIAHGAIAGGGGSSSNITSSATQRTFSNLGQDIRQRRTTLEAEIHFLKTLAQELTDDVQMMEQSRQLAHQARTRTGRIHAYMGLVFSLVLLLRLAFALATIQGWSSLSSSSTSSSNATTHRSDPITVALVWLMGRQWIQIRDYHDYNNLSQLVSLALTAVLSLSQIRTLLLTVALANRRLSRLFFRKCQPLCTEKSPIPCFPTNTHNYSNHHHSKNHDICHPTSWSALLEDVYVHGMASCIICYCVACLVVTKLLLPPVYQSDWSAALGVSLTVRAAPTQSIFVGAAGISVLVLGALLGWERQQSYRYAQEAATVTPTMLTTHASHHNLLDP
jgi:hypothetical protein